MEVPDWKAAAEGDSESWTEIAARMDGFTRRMEARAAEHRAKLLAAKTNWILDNAWLCWRKDDLILSLCESPVWHDFERMKVLCPELFNPELMRVGRFNGYVTFPKLPVVAPGYRGILTYVPVHGGITYCQDWWDGSFTYGFDCGHAHSGEMGEIINDVDWMMHETESMAHGIQVAARFEPYYLRAEGDDAKARVLDRMGQFLPLEVQGNFGAMINVMFGGL